MDKIERKKMGVEDRTGRGMSVAEFWSGKFCSNAMSKGKYFKAKNDLMNYHRLKAKRRHFAPANSGWD